MLCSLLNREGLGFVFGSVLGFIDRSVSTAMGCFIGCFRVRDDRRRGTRSRAHLVADTSHPKLTEVVVSQNRLSSLFMSEDSGDSICNKKSSPEVETPDIDNELKNEAKFLKACGTLAETPIEIRKASAKWFGGSPVHDGELDSSKFHSWLPNTSIKKLQLEKPIDQPSTPIKLSEARAEGLVSLEHTPSSCISTMENARSININSGEGSGTDSTCTPPVATTNAEPRSKSVRFKCDLDLSSSRGSSLENYSQNPKKGDSMGIESMERSSPFPTPLKLSDEMQTPGTVFPANLGNLNGKTRIRSQYVYSVQNPVESVSQWNELKQEDHNSHQLSGEFRDSFGRLDVTTPEAKAKIKESSLEEMKVEASLSAWLKPVAAVQGGNFVGISSRPQVARTPMERPIIGTVAAHWNDEEPTRVSPKWWDGNGIPNSTNKYKEDQKVRWHATPFEERLEKALSEESVVSQRKPICGTPIAFDENEESDTAFSQMQSSSHSKSVVSF